MTVPLTREHQPHALPADLVHDLRSPLTQILGYTEMLMEQARECQGQEFLPDLQRVHTAGRNLLAVIDDRLAATVTTGAAKSEVASPEPPQLRVETQPAPTASREGHDKHAQHGSLLVVDDIEANRDVLSRRLRRHGHSVATAEDGRIALDRLRAEPFDLVLLDIMMPEIDGFEVLRRMKSDEQLRHIPVIIISALNELDAVARCIEMGAEDYLSKPFNPTLLKARTHACLEKKWSRDRESQLYTQLSQNFQRLQELEKQRDDLTHMIIHDLRTPLVSVITGMQTLDLMGTLNAEQREMMTLSVSGGETLLGMINDLLDVEKLESGAMQLDYSEVAPSQLVSSALAQVTSLAAGKELTLLQERDEMLPLIRCDEGKLRRTLVNLLGNAVKFTPSGGTVTVGVCPADQGGSVTFSVADTGEGIPAEAFGSIFEKFGQVKTRQGGRVMSTGLGLTFCKLAVEAHGGQIGLESRLGEGSTFCFTIPVTPLSEAVP